MMSMCKKMLVLEVKSVFLQIKTSGNLGVNSYQLVLNTLLDLTSLKLNTLIIYTLVSPQSVIFITHSTLQTGIRET